MTENTTHSRISSQVSLPMSVAFEVVAQGIRIRFGRSMVTVTGVLFGIAFLMSIFTGLVLKKGVSAEENLRIETNRMVSFLTAESGQPTGQTMGLILNAPLQTGEQRLLLKLEEMGLAKLQVAAPPDVPLPVLSRTQVTRVPAQAVAATDASAVLWTGEEPARGRGWDTLFTGAPATRHWSHPRRESRSAFLRYPRSAAGHGAHRRSDRQQARLEERRKSFSAATGSSSFLFS